MNERIPVVEAARLGGLNYSVSEYFSREKLKPKPTKINAFRTISLTKPVAKNKKRTTTPVREFMSFDDSHMPRGHSPRRPAHDPSPPIETSYDPPAFTTSTAREYSKDDLIWKRVNVDRPTDYPPAKLNRRPPVVVPGRRSYRSTVPVPEYASSRYPDYAGSYLNEWEGASPTTQSRTGTRGPTTAGLATAYPAGPGSPNTRPTAPEHSVPTDDINRNTSNQSATDHVLEVVCGYDQDSCYQAKRF